MGGPFLVFSLVFMAFVCAKGLPATKETISRKTQQQQQIGGEGDGTSIEASRWPSLAEVITKAGNGIKPSASLLDILNSDQINSSRGAVSSLENKYRDTQNSLPATTTTSSSTTMTMISEIPATVFDVADFGITDIGWNEDNIKLDFITVNDLRRLIEKAGGKLDHSLYAQSATHVASLSLEDKIKHGFITTKTTSTTTTPSTTETVSATKHLSSSSTTTASTTPFLTTKLLPTSSTLGSTATSYLITSEKRLPFLNTTTTTSTTTTTTTTESTPYPPVTLSLGAWQITEEDLPIYVGSAAGVLLLIIVLLGVTTWRCCLVPSHASINQSNTKSKEDTSSISTPQNNNGLPQHVEASNRPEQPPPEHPSHVSPTTNGKAEPDSRPSSRFIVNLSSVIADHENHKSHESMVCLAGSRVESRIVSPGHSKGNKVTKQSSPVATLTQRRTTPFDANCSPTRATITNAGKACNDLVSGVSESTYVRVPPVDHYVSTSNGATTFHTFQPNNSRSNSDKNSCSSSPDECGYISNTANKGSSLSTPPTVRSTPSSEALDVVADLRYEAMRFRSLPHSSRPLTLATSSRETNGNHLDDIQDHAQAPASAMSSGVPPNMSIPLVGLKHFQPMILNGNTNNTSPRSQQHNIEDMYAKVNFTTKAANKCRDSQSNNGQVAVVQPLTLNRIAQRMSPPAASSGLSGSGGGGVGHVGSGVMTTFVPKANCNMMMTSSTIVTSFDETDDVTEDSLDMITKASLTSKISSADETSSLFHSMKTSL